MEMIIQKPINESAKLKWSGLYHQYLVAELCVVLVALLSHLERLSLDIAVDSHAAALQAIGISQLSLKTCDITTYSRLGESDLKAILSCSVSLEPFVYEARDPSPMGCNPLLNHFAPPDAVKHLCRNKALRFQHLDFCMNLQRAPYRDVKRISSLEDFTALEYTASCCSDPRKLSSLK
ncbi:hypothetical protein F5884DRAFT_744652 [Xylogone sp. PMI_703]|nr:hypothetical protein F5884DRAFT_744652 [Xylogone sp. PMI_703]